jgi:protein-S-isoprenylcysteine O-methyltransferase Ste14
MVPYLLLKQFDKGYFKKRMAEITGKKIPLTKTEQTIDRDSTSLLVFLFIYPIFLPLQLETMWFIVSLAIFSLGIASSVFYQIPGFTTPPDEPFTEGIYRYSRHPLFLSIFLRFVGVGVGIGVVICSGLPR